MILKLGVVARNLFIDWFGGSTRTNRGLLMNLANYAKDLEVELLPVVDEVYWLLRDDKAKHEAVSKWADLYERSGLHVNEKLIRHYINGTLHKLSPNSYVDELRSYDVLYDPILMPMANPNPLSQVVQALNPEHVDLLYLKHTSGKLAALLIGISDVPLRLKWWSRLMANYGFLSPKESVGLAMFILRSKALLKALLPYRNRVLLLSPSPGALENVDAVGKFRSVSFYPFYAVDERVFRIPRNCKEDYLVFFSRGDVTKGVLELPKIMSYLRKLGCDYKLKVVSGFASPRIKRAFTLLTSLYDVKNLIEIVNDDGYVPDSAKEKMLDFVSKALLTLYPSHADVVPNVVVESLFLMTPVVMYDIPGPYGVFKGSRAISFVKEFNVKGFASAVCRMLRNYDLNELFDNEKTRKILEAHRDWRPIVNKYVDIVMNLTEEEHLRRLHQR